MTVLGAHPARLDLAVHSGDPVDFTVTVLDDTGGAVDLSGWDVSATATAADGTVLHNFTTTGSSAGVVEAAATEVETAAWAWSVYAARLVVSVTPPGGSPIPQTVGWIRLYRP